MKNLDFSKNPLILAPMAGVTDVGFRALASSFGADATITEMLSARAMLLVNTTKYRKRPNL